MGRISKRGSSLSKVEEKASSACPDRRYRAGIYARLSSNQDLRKNESIETQIEIAKKFIDSYNQSQKEETIEIIECYTDLGKTGSNFNRDNFERMMQDIRLGEINCVVVKDLSRFGRNYLEAGNYIEKIFPFLGVRFISVADDFDTGMRGNNTKQMSFEIKNLINDMYAKDFSKKAKLHLKQRREEGSYVGGPPPYGYIAIWEGKKRKLRPDENTSAIIAYIYNKFLESKSYTLVADALNQRRVNPPAIYKKTGEAFYPLKDMHYKGWEKGSVERILKSETYVGTLVQGKTSITAKDENNRVQKSQAEWVVKENIHEALIGKEEYERVQKIREELHHRTAAQKKHTDTYPLEENIFDQVLYCGVCGRKLTRTSRVKAYADGNKARLDGYLCINGKSTKVTICKESNRISKNELVDILLPFIRTEFSVFLAKPNHFLKYGKELIGKTKIRLEQEMRKIDGQIFRFTEEEGQSYINYQTGKMSQKEYVVYKLNKEDKLESLLKQKKANKKEQMQLEGISKKYQSVLRNLLKMRGGKLLTKELIEALIEKIYVYPGKRIEVFFTFTMDSLDGVK